MGLNVERKTPPHKDKKFQAVSVRLATYRKLKVLAAAENASLANTITALLEYYEANK